MKKIIMKIDGMACGMCETHINDVVRKCVSVKKVTSSHKKGMTEVICEDDVNASVLKDAVDATGYEVLDIKEEPYVKKGFLWF